MDTHEGRFAWADLTTPDCPAAARFYGALLHWEIEDTATDMGVYVVGKLDGQQVAGMMAQDPSQQGMPPMWQIYLGSERLEDTLTRIEAAAGSVVVPPMDIPDARIAAAADPTGGMFSLIESAEDGGFDFYGGLGSVCWAEVLTPRPDKAIEFYTTVFGWDAKTETSPVAGPYTTFMRHGQPMLGVMMMPEAVPAGAPAFWQLYFKVGDVDDTAAMAKDLGGGVLVPKMPVGEGVYFATLQDPQGAGFSILEGEM
jgi:predicted enzyme related to lactoylglutathione lyase